MREEALGLAAAGWKVLPVWWLEDLGDVRVCGCGNPFCNAPGKHPLIATGKRLGAASSETTQVEAWWREWPNANVAVACGEASGVIVIDCDVKDDVDGDIVLREWLSGVGLDDDVVLRTLSQTTGSGGAHYLFRYEPGVKNCISWLDHVDVKSDGGYILIAPSNHVTGGMYRWRDITVPIATMPEQVLGAIRAAKSRVTHGKGAQGEDPVYDYRTCVKYGPKAGYRDHFFNARAFELRKSGVSREDAEGDLRRLYELTEQRPGDAFTWETVLGKLERVWGEVEPEPLPDWHWEPGGTPVGRTVLVNDRPEDVCTDVGNAWRLVNLHSDKIRHTTAEGWFVWNGEIWLRDDRDKVWELVRETVGTIFQEAVTQHDDEARDRLLDWARKSLQRQRIEAAVKLTNTFDRIKLHITDFDADPWVLTVGNGTLNLRTGELREFSRDDMITKRTHIKYDPDAYDERWVRYLEDSTGGDQDFIGYLRRAAGYTLTGLTTEEVLFFIYGPKHTGKSTFVTALETLLGDYAMTTQPDTLMHRRGNQAPRDELARMRGRRLVTTSEPEHGDRFAVGLVKQMTGGDKMSGRFLYRDAFEFHPTHKLWISSNIRPRTGADEALFRRLREVPFSRQIPAETRDVTLKADLQNPRSPLAAAVLAWAVRGCLEWQQHGLGTTAVVEETTQDYLHEEDLIGQFIEECITRTGARDDIMVMKDVYATYREWSQERGDHVMTQQSLRRALEERGYPKVRPARTSSVWGGRLDRTALTWVG